VTRSAVWLRRSRDRIQVLVEEVRLTRRGVQSRRWKMIIDLPAAQVTGRALSHIAELR
jgi:hypothetical protein